MDRIDEIRKEFPILNQTIHGNYPLIYLDNAATTQKPMTVVDSIVEYYTHYNANVHRGVHYLSGLATDMFEKARWEVKEFINADSKDEIIFTRGTTDSINLLAHCFSKTFLKEEDSVWITEMEHHSNIVPWQIAQEDYHFTLDYIPFDDKGDLILDKLYKCDERSLPKILSLTHISNTLGTINPVKEIISFCHRHGVFVLVDGAQAIAHTTVDVKDLDADFYAFSGHKVYAPMGIGVLYGKKNLLDRMVVYQGGGEMIKEVTLKKTTFNDLPYKYEAGTPSVADAIGLGVALKWFKSIGLKEVFDYEENLFGYLTDGLKTIAGLTIYGQSANKSSCISFLVDGVHHLDLGTLLDAMGIAIRTGHHCAEPVMQHYGILGTDRASLAFYNTKEEIDIFVSSLKKAVTMLK